MLQSTEIPSLILILVAALIIFGLSKLLELARAAGTSLKEFKTSARNLDSEAQDVKEG